MIAGDHEMLLANERRALELYEQVGDENAALQRARAPCWPPSSRRTTRTRASSRRRTSRTSASAAHGSRSPDGDVPGGGLHASRGRRAVVGLSHRSARDLHRERHRVRDRARAGHGRDRPGVPWRSKLAARIAGTTYELVREKSVMLAPVKVLHLPEPADLGARGPGRGACERADGEGAAIPVSDMVAMVVAAPAPQRAQHRSRSSLTSRPRRPSGRASAR